MENQKCQNILCYSKKHMISLRQKLATTWHRFWYISELSNGLLLALNTRPNRIFVDPGFDHVD